jgi:hypothetical protein
MKGAGVASAIVFMLLVSMVRTGDKSTFGTSREEEDFTSRIGEQVKEANKAGASKWRRPEQR